MKLILGLAIVFLCSLEVADKPDKAPPPPPEEDSLSSICPGFDCNRCGKGTCSGLCAQLCVSCHCYF